jgi:CheY-like chemotaxis protein
LVKALGNLGYENVDSASDGADAWQAIHEVGYDLVITDHKMPRVTGLELIERMRSEAMTQPVILISGTMPTGELNRNPSLRVDAMLSKPFTVSQLAAIVGKFLQPKESQSLTNRGQISQPEQSAIAPTQVHKNSSPRILILDDDCHSRQLQIDLLTSSGYQVEAVNDGAAGWDALRTCDYDLVITDNHMPRMTGLEMIEKLHLSQMAVPVIMATGSLPTDEFARKPWLRPEAALQKPFANHDLLETISNVLDADGGKEDHKPTPLPRFF